MGPGSAAYSPYHDLRATVPLTIEARTMYHCCVQMNGGLLYGFPEHFIVIAFKQQQLLKHAERHACRSEPGNQT